MITSGAKALMTKVAQTSVAENDVVVALIACECNLNAVRCLTVSRTLFRVFAAVTGDALMSQ